MLLSFVFVIGFFISTAVRGDEFLDSGEQEAFVAAKVVPLNVEIETDIGREGEDEVTAQGPMTTTTTTAAPSRAKRSPPPQPAAKQQKSNKAAGAKKAAKKVGGKIGKGVKFAFKKTKNAANAVKNKVTKKK
ncbi:hypothetical protein D918_09160 [Trichuris suis]|nr:hypothetical protein D918_09160 [Trichuris suis]